MKKNNKKKSDNVAVNKKARFNYELKDEYEAGLVLKGWQIKAIKAGRVSVENNPHVIIDRKGEAWLSGMIINPLMEASTHEFKDSNASIKLLLHKKEISRMIGLMEQKGFTIVLNKLYFKNHILKAKINLAKGKNAADKRQTIKERDSKIEAQRAVKSFR